MLCSFSRVSNSLTDLNVPSSNVAVSGCPKHIDAISLYLYEKVLIQPNLNKLWKRRAAAVWS